MATNEEIIEPRHVKRRKIANQPNSTLTSEPADIQLQVIQSGCPGYERCVMLSTNFTKYLFNCPEGVQRLGSEFKTKVTRVEHLFVTHCSWLNIGGMMGLSYTMRDARSKELHAYGSSGVELIFETTKPLADSAPPVNLVMHDFETQPIFEDPGLTITQVPLFPEETIDLRSPSPRRSSTSSSSNYSEDELSYSNIQIDTKRNSLQRLAAKLIKSSALPLSKIRRIVNNSERNKTLVLAFVVEPKKRTGKMNLSRCVELGIPIGPMLGQLQRGQSVTLECGKVITPDMVQLAPPDTPVSIILECPSNAYITALSRNEILKKYIQSDRLAVIVHMTPADVYESPEYGNWMKSIPPYVDHLVLNEKNPSTPHSIGIFNQQARLNMVDDSVYPLLQSHKNVPDESKDDEMCPAGDSDQLASTSSQQETKPQNNQEQSAEFRGSREPAFDLDYRGSIIKARPCLKYVLRPLTRVDDSECLVFQRKSVERLVRNLGPYSEALEFTQSALRQRGFVSPLLDSSLSTSLNLSDTQTGRFPEIVFLGTGSACPGKTRNVSCIWVNISESSAIIMDCGEGSTIQLRRLYGEEGSRKELLKLKGMLISHLHADHHLGLTSVVLARKEAFKHAGLPYTQLYVMAPPALFSMYNAFSLLSEDIRSLYTTVSPRATTSARAAEIRTRNLGEMLKLVGLKAIEVVSVFHPQHANGYILRTLDGKKLVYSGDTMPCEPLIEAGMNADVLIHEATMDDALADEAFKKRHSTLSQALGVAQAMRARHTILTHFSARYGRIPLITDEMARSARFGIAFDFMTVPYNKLHILPLYIPMLKAVFSDYHEEMEWVSQKRAMKQSILKSIGGGSSS